MLLHLRYAIRSLRKSPAFTLAAILTLALGIGANTAIFSVLQGVVLAPLPYPDPDRLAMVLLYNQNLKHPTYLSYPDFLDWQRQATSFDSMAVYDSEGFDLTSPGAPDHLEGHEISAAFFRTLGVKPALGRDFTPEDDRPGAAPGVILTSRLWRSAFNADPAAIGKTAVLNGTGYTIAGVLPDDFRFQGDTADLYTAIGRGSPTILTNRTVHDLGCIARLKPATTIAQAHAEMDAIQEGLERQFPETEKGQRTYLQPLKQFLVADTGKTLRLLLGAVGLVLLIACANVANLVLARSAARAREFSVRLALGARRAHLIRQLITESVLLALAGGILGSLFASWGIRTALVFFAGSLPRTENICVNFTVLGFAFALSTAVGILCGIVPAIKHSNTDLQTALKQSGRGSASGHHGTQRALVILQVALALILLTSASLLFRTIQSLWRVNPGFDVHNLVTFKVGLSPEMVQTPESTRIAYQQLVDRIRAIPGIESAEVTALIPLSQRSNSGGFWAGPHDGQSVAQAPRTTFYWTGPDYLRTMKIPLLRGRFLSAHDTIHTDLAIVIDNALARAYFPGQDPVGQTITIPQLGPIKIVGVVGHVQHWRLDGSDRLEPQNQVYLSFYQLPDRWQPAFRSDLSIALRTSLGASSAIAAVRRQVQPVYQVETMQDFVAGSMAAQRFPLVLLGAFAALALLLAWVGVYGVISYSVAQRVREVGIRMAIGATRRDVLGMVIGQGLRLTAIGVVLGSIAALMLAKAVSSFSNLLFGVRATDPLIFTTVAATLLIASIVACYVPARRAAHLDPLTALHHE